MFLGICLSLLVSGCGEESDLVYHYVNVPLGSHDVVMSEQDVVDVSIGLAGENYRVTSDDPAVVTATVVGMSIRLEAGTVGKTMVRLSDDGFNRALMQVEVRQLYELSLETLPDGIDVLRLDNDGTAKTLKILTGNGGYTAASSDPEAVEASVEADPDVEGGFRLVLQGRSNATGVVVTVRDVKGKQAQITCRVTDPLVPVSFDVEGPFQGEYVYGSPSESVRFRIVTGNGGYAVSSTNEQVATARIEGETVELTIVGDGGTTITVLDQEHESRSIELWVPLNTEDPTARIYWDGYRADLSTPGVVNRSTFATKKHIYWDQTNEDGSVDTRYLSFNGIWSDGLECVGAFNRSPILETTIGGVTTTYNDQDSEIRLTSLQLVKRIGISNSSPQHIYYFTFSTDDGRQGFLVQDWKQTVSE